MRRGLLRFPYAAPVDRTYLPMYLSEFQYRWNRRKTSDAERFEALLGQTEGRLDWYLTA